MTHRPPSAVSHALRYLPGPLLRRTGHACIALSVMLASCFQFGCTRGPESPEQVANAFVRQVKRDEAKAWAYYSGPSQAKIRAESARLIETTPYYVEAFKPEKLYSGRFCVMIAGSARVQKIEGSNATLMVQRRESAGFALPGFSGIGWKKVPDEMLLVEEQGVWKIDVARPSTEERKFFAARQKAIQAELDAISARGFTNRLRLERSDR